MAHSNFKLSHQRIKSTLVDGYDTKSVLRSLAALPSHRGVDLSSLDESESPRSIYRKRIDEMRRHSQSERVEHHQNIRGPDEEI